MATSYQKNEKFKEAANTWQMIIDQSRNVNKISPNISLIICLLEMGDVDQAVVSSVELVSLLDAAADEIEPIKDQCDDGICNLAKKFVDFNKFDLIFQLVHCRFELLKRNYTGKDMFIRMCNIACSMRDVSMKVTNDSDVESFKNQYCLLDDVLLFMQNSPVNDVDWKNKCKNVALFLGRYGSLCDNIKDYTKAMTLLNQSIVFWKTTFGVDSEYNRDLGVFYNNLGYAFALTNNLGEATFAYQKSLEIKKQARDYETDYSKREDILVTSKNLQRVQNRLNST